MNCPHGFPSPKSCVDCMMDGPVEPPKTIRRRLPTTHVIIAKYDGDCANCGGRIHEGYPIGHVDDVGWCCDLCFDV